MHHDSSLSAISPLASIISISLPPREAGVAVGPYAWSARQTTADLAFALMLAAARRVAEGDRFVRAGRWRMWTPRLMLGRDVWGATLGYRMGLARLAKPSRGAQRASV